MELRHPVAKSAGACKSSFSPFPIPIASVTGKPCDKSRWYHYQGKWNGDSVSVRNEGDVKMLYEMGFFGKGILSRGKPNFQFVSGSFQRSFKRKRYRRGLRRKLQVSFKPIRKEKRKRHKQWREEYEWYASHPNSTQSMDTSAQNSAPSPSSSSKEDYSESSSSSDDCDNPVTSNIPPDVCRFNKSKVRLNTFAINRERMQYRIGCTSLYCTKLFVSDMMIILMT